VAIDLKRDSKKKWGNTLGASIFGGSKTVLVGGVSFLGMASTTLGFSGSCVQSGLWKNRQ